MGKHRLPIVRIVLFPGLLALLLSSVASLSAAGQTSVDSVEKALTFLQQIDPEKVTAANEEKIIKQIEDAWDVIHKAGPAGTARLKQEIARPNQSDYFKLNGAALLWSIGGLDEAETISSVWGSTRLEVQSNYVFYPAFEAGQKQDPRALPMLRAVLGNNKFKIYVALHSMDVSWPLTIQFIWGSYGPQALPILLDVLKNSRVPAEVQSAIVLSATDQYLEALPRIRELAHAKDDETQRVAINALGFFGHPEDYDFLIAGLGSQDQEDVFRYEIALYEYEDLRAVPHLIPLLGSRDRKIRHEAFADLSHLLTSQSLDALVKYAQEVQGEERAEVDDYLNSELKEYKLSVDAYMKKSPVEKAQTIGAVRKQREARRFSLHPGERGLTHSELVAATEAWKSSHHMRMSSGEMPVSVAQLLSATTANDIDLLLKVKAAVYGRLSDECLDEVERIDSAVKRLGRSRYRKHVGVTEKVEPRQ